MKRLVLLPSCLLTGLLWLGCKSTASNDVPTVQCQANQLSKCLCADGKNLGQHKCNGNGSGFGKCEIATGMQCPNGEAPPEVHPPACAGDEASLVLDSAIDVVMQGTSAGASTQTGIGECSGTSGSEKIYTVAVGSGGGKASIRVEASGFTPIVYVRESDCESGTQVACSGSKGTPATTSFDAKAGRIYTLFVDSDGGSGNFKLTMHLDAVARCGDGTVQAPEVCDDQNVLDGDGCNAKCDLVDGDADTGKTCPGQAIHVWDTPAIAKGSNGSGLSIYSSTFCLEDDFDPSGDEANEHVYAVTAHKTGTMTATTSASDFDHALYARGDCRDSEDERDCASAAPNTGGEKIAFSVTDGKTYFVFVDGLYKNAMVETGNYTLTLSIK